MTIYHDSHPPLGGVTPSYIDAYTCAEDLGGCTPIYILHTRAFRTYLLGGLFTFAKKIEGDDILHVNMFQYSKISYITCTFFTFFTSNEYNGPYFFIALCF